MMFVREHCFMHTYIDVFSCLFGYNMYIHAYLVVVINKPPENTTVCRGSDVTISCGYLKASALPVTWIINGTSFTQQEVVDSPLYQLNNPNNPKAVSLTAFSINHTTTFQCIVLSTANTTSTLGTVTVTTGMYVSTCVRVWLVLYN